MLLLAALLLACEPQPPAVCDEMCAAAAGLYGACLEDWGLDWSAAGYEDEDDYLESCRTWAWEMALLQQDALERGVEEAEGWLGTTCALRLRAFRSEDASCETYTSLDWEPAWEEDAR